MPKLTYARRFRFFGFGLVTSDFGAFMIRRIRSVMRSIGVFSNGVGGTDGLALDRLAMFTPGEKSYDA